MRKWPISEIFDFLIDLKHCILTKFDFLTDLGAYICESDFLIDLRLHGNRRFGGGSKREPGTEKECVIAGNRIRIFCLKANRTNH